MKLTGRTILITGGSAGIGLAFALKFAELGNEVIVTGRRQKVLDEVKGKHPNLHAMQSDVADPAQIAALARSVRDTYPKLDVLMNNAGIMLHKNLKVPAPDLDGLIAEVSINVAGVMRMSSAFIDILTANNGTIINVSSGLAFVPLPSAPIYSDQSSRSCLYPVAPVPIGGDWRGSDRAHATGSQDRLVGRNVRGRRRHCDHHGRVGEAVVRFPQGGRTRDPPRAGQTARVHAPLRSQFHQQAALEGFEEIGSGRSEIRQLPTS